MAASAISRRAVLASSGAALWRADARLKIGAMDGVCGKRSNPAAIAVAQRCGIEGVQVTLGSRMELAEPERQARFVEESRKHRVPIVATYIDLLHSACLKNDPEAVKFAVQGIDITRKLGAPILMLVFFGKCALESRAEMEALIGPLREVVREAEKARVVLGFENTIPADDDLRILDAVRSKALQIYYDVGNATNLYNVSPAAEIRKLKGHICQFHFKDRGYLGEGKVDVPAALDAIRATGWTGYIVLETGAPSKDVEADLRKNRDYLTGQPGWRLGRAG